MFLPVSDLPPVHLQEPLRQSVVQGVADHPVRVCAGDQEIVMMKAEQYETLVAAWEQASTLHDLTIAVERWSQATVAGHKDSFRTTEEIMGVLGWSQDQLDALDD